jgi:hypothetical protein
VTRADRRRFSVRRLWLAPGQQVAYRRAGWRDALVVVERGDLEVRYRDGDTARFGGGAVLWLDSLPVRSLRNPGHLDAVITAVSRAHAAPPTGAGPRTR